MTELDNATRLWPRRALGPLGKPEKRRRAGEGYVCQKADPSDALWTSVPKLWINDQRLWIRSDRITTDLILNSTVSRAERLRAHWLPILECERP